MLYGESDYYQGRIGAAQLYGMNPGNGSRAAGHVLPLTTAGAGDAAGTWWSPDSSAFWVIALIGATVLGMAGADARVRLGKRRASVQVGQT